jgi:hypothetical protein
MKSCGRLLNGVKCGTIFEGAGAYCRDCRNAYQRDYYASRKAHPHETRSAELDVTCESCDAHLRSSTIAYIKPEDVPGLQVSIRLCETCKAAITYLYKIVDEAAQEFIVSTALELSNLLNNSPMQHSTTSAPSIYAPQVLQQGNSVACGACDDLAEVGKEFCRKHAHYASYTESNAAKMARGEL